jgi:hypothetical protein
LEEENAKTQGRKDARVVDLPQRSGCSLHPLERSSNRAKKKKQKICEFKAHANVAASQGCIGTLENRVFLVNRWVSNWV